MYLRRREFSSAVVARLNLLHFVNIYYRIFLTSLVYINYIIDYRKTLEGVYFYAMGNILNLVQRNQGVGINI